MSIVTVITPAASKGLTTPAAVVARMGEGDPTSQTVIDVVANASDAIVGFCHGRVFGLETVQESFQRVNNAREGALVLAVGTDRQFAALCEVLGEADLARDERFAINASRVTNRVELRALLQRRLACGPATEWARRLTDARVPAGVVNDLAGAFALAESLGLEPVVRIPRDDGGVLALPRNPIGLSESPPTYRFPPPPLPAPQDAGAVGWLQTR